MFLNILVKFDPLRFSTFCMTSGNMMLFLTATKEKLRKHCIKIAFSSVVKTMALHRNSLRISDHEKTSTSLSARCYTTLWNLKVKIWSSCNEWLYQFFLKINVKQLHISKRAQFQKCMFEISFAYGRSLAPSHNCRVNEAVIDRRLRPQCCHRASYFKRPKSSSMRTLACNWYL